MRRLSCLVFTLVMVATMSVAPSVAAAEESCVRFSAHSSLSGNVAAPGFEGPISLSIAGGPVMEGSVAGSFLSDVDSTGTYTFEDGTFSDLVVNVIRPTPDPALARFTASGDFIDGTGAFDGVSGYIQTRGTAAIDELGNYTTTGMHTGVMCFGNGEA